MTKRGFLALAIAGLTGCGGGGGSVSSIPQQTSASSSASIGATGGTLKAVDHGTTATVTYPAGALSSTVNVTLTYFTASHLPRAASSFSRKPLSLPTNATILGAVEVDAGGATLAKPLSLSLTVPAVSAGTSIMISGSSSPTTDFADVDTTTLTSGTATDAGSTAYTGPTLDTASALYVFYSAPTASLSSPPAIAIPISGPASVDDGQTATYASGVESNSAGFPYLSAGTTTWSLDNSVLGSIASSGVFTASLSAQASGNVIATDSAHPTIVTKYPVSVLSSRPATVGDSLSYSGTTSEVLTANALATAVPVPFPSSSPGAAASPVPPAFNESGTVIDTVSVTATPAPGQITTASDEFDKYQLETLETKTTSNLAYQASGSTTAVRQLTTSATDSNGSTFANAYTATSGEIAVLPETNGATFSNDASDTYTETDPGIGGSLPTEQRVTNSDGSYTDTQVNTDGSQNVAQANADLSGTYSFIGGFFLATFSAPTASGIGLALQAGGPGNYGPPQNIEQPLWYPSVTSPLYAETDTVTTSTSLDSHCGTAFGSTGNLTAQAITSIDPVFGTVTTETTKTYDVIGVGVVCTIFNETVNQYIDYSLQEGEYALIYDSTATLPLYATTYNEVLSLQSASVASSPSAQSLARKSSASNVRAVPESLTRAAVAVARTRFEHRVRQDQLKRIATLIAKARLARGGVK